ncbi:MAG TPA: hypothetical protein VFH98_08145 [Candidatus Limnocylindria bacterium]|nr:hypothetical protein [Candidatus Limnocylindria bacterium]
MSELKHRIHVLPRLRRVGGLLLPNWLAITLGRDIFAWRELTPAELEHELEHVRQWGRYTVLFPLLYLGASVAALVTRRGWYRGNHFEVQARAAAEPVRPARGISEGRARRG